MISIVLNTDTRPVNRDFSGMYNGVRSKDFIGKNNLANKRQFFHELDTELIVHVDEHESVTGEQYAELRDNSDCLIIRKHARHYRGANPFNAFNDINYLQALFMARGEYIAHFDQDMAALSLDSSVINDLISQLNDKSFICYPSVNAPDPCHAPEYAGKWWASTRFFICRRETLKFDDLERAIREPEWFYNTYDRPPRLNPWTEQFLGIMGGYRVVYPQPRLDRWAVFPWNHYEDGTLAKLNSIGYGPAIEAVHRAGGAGAFYDGIDSRNMRI